MARGAVLRPSRWLLRTRLIALLVGLLAAICVLLGLVSTVALQHFLVNRLDTQLVAAGERSGEAAKPGPKGQPRPGATDTGARFLLAPGQPAGTLGARIDGDDVVGSGVLSDSGALEALPASASKALLRVPADGVVRTLDVPELGSFRVVAQRLGTSDVLLTGLPLKEVSATVYQLVAVVTAGSVTALVMAGLLAAVIVRRNLRPLGRVATLATHVSALPLASGEVELGARVPAGDTDPRTEVGQVGSALNLLLDTVGGALSARQASETRVRQFVADASHELRTPLAAIRGYAELSRRCREPIPPDVAHALARVEAESLRMTALVEDLLLLARLDEGRPLESEPVDLTSVVIDAVSDASAAGPDHSWRLDLPGEPVEVVGDRARLHQVLANLLGNARAHTPGGSTVITSVTATATDVFLTVLDDGPGLPAELVPRAFERFTRGDTSRARAAGGGSGLGLGIVSAIVAAHGGSVDVTSRPGRTAFRVRLSAPGVVAAATSYA